MVKAAISFANWEGGFIIFGVSPSGEWRGLAPSDLAAVDPANLSELINGCIAPEIPILNYVDFVHAEKSFGVLHVPPSAVAPHVTTKEIVEKDGNGKLRLVLSRHALYSRQGAKSDLATPHQHHQLLNRRTEAMRAELLRRVKEVPILVPTRSASSRSPIGGGTLTLARLTSDPNAPAIRITRKAEDSTGVLLHEELSDGLFDEINNVIDANTLLASGTQSFVLGEPIYYRVYAERHHVEAKGRRIPMLARSGLHDFYAPTLFWLLSLSAPECAAVIREAADEMKMPQIHGLIRVITLLGHPASDWLWERFERVWGKHTQKPDCYWALRDIRSAKLVDRRLLALRSGGKTQIEVSDSESATLDRLIASPSELAGFLSRACLAVFEGKKQFKHSARYLDILTYGSEFEAASPKIAEALLSE